MADEVVDAAPAVVDTPAAGAPVEVQQPTGAAVTEPVAAPVEDEFSALEKAFDTPADPAAPVDPVAPEAAAVPEQFSQLLTISPYVKSPEHAQAAIQAASEVWAVADGQVPARTLLEGMKQARPQQFEAVKNDLISYLEQETGQKFGAGANEALTPEQQRLAALEARETERQTAAERYQQQQTFNRADTLTTDKVTELTKGTFLEGDKDFVRDIFAALPDLKIDPKQMMQEVLAGKFDLLEKAKRGAETKVVARIQAFNKKFIADQRAKRNALPTSSTGGNPGGGDSKFDLSTREGRMAHAMAGSPV